MTNVTLDFASGLLYNDSANDNANDNAISEVGMSKRVTMTDVAQEAGVSLMTVSRVVNNKDGVSDRTRQRVLEVVDALGYRPSSIARGLVTKHTNTLGIVVPDIANPFFSSIARGAEQQAYAETYSVFVGNTDEEPKRERAILESLEDKRVDGILLCSSRLDEAELAEMVDRFPAVVLVSRKLDHDGCVGVILIADELGGKIATQHLIQSGHRNIGLITGPQISHSTRGRFKGYQTALEQADIPYNPDWVRYCSPVITQGRDTAYQLLEDNPELTALFCHNDLVAVGALQACTRLGLDVPDDIAIVGFDDIDMAAIVSPALTTLRVDRAEIGRSAMRMLLAQIQDCSETPREIVLEPELVVRESAPALLQVA
jgi:LacI family transcriptional regulator